MEFKTDSLPTTADSHKVGRVMRDVLYALIPGALVMIWFFGWGTVSNLVLGITFAVALEALMLKMRQLKLHQL